MSEEPPKVAPILTSAAEFSDRARAGLVMIRMGDNIVTMLPARAREFALGIFANAERAEAEEGVVDFFITKMGMHPHDARLALAEFRRHRDAMLPREEQDVQGRMQREDEA